MTSLVQIKVEVSLLIKAITVIQKKFLVELECDGSSQVYVKSSTKKYSKHCSACVSDTVLKACQNSIILLGRASSLPFAHIIVSMIYDSRMPSKFMRALCTHACTRNSQTRIRWRMKWTRKQQRWKPKTKNDWKWILYNIKS